MKESGVERREEKRRESFDLRDEVQKWRMIQYLFMEEKKKMGGLGTSPESPQSLLRLASHKKSMKTQNIPNPSLFYGCCSYQLQQRAREVLYNVLSCGCGCCLCYNCHHEFSLDILDKLVNYDK
jgi:hypothetical protein